MGVLAAELWLPHRSSGIKRKWNTVCTVAHLPAMFNTSTQWIHLFSAVLCKGASEILYATCCEIKVLQSSGGNGLLAQKRSFYPKKECKCILKWIMFKGTSETCLQLTLQLVLNQRPLQGISWVRRKREKGSNPASCRERGQPEMPLQLLCMLLQLRTWLIYRYCFEWYFLHALTGSELQGKQRSWDEVIPLSWMALSSSFVSTGQQDGHPRRWDSHSRHTIDCCWPGGYISIPEGKEVPTGS